MEEKIEASLRPSLGSSPTTPQCALTWGSGRTLQARLGIISRGLRVGPSGGAAGKDGPSVILLYALLVARALAGQGWRGRSCVEGRMVG